MARGGKRAGAGRKLSYKSYEKQYDAMKNKLAAKGISMFQRKLSESEFKAQYLRLKNQREKDVRDGKRQTLGNITRDLIDKQAYELTQKQAKALLEKKRKEMGLSIQEVRSGLWLAKEQYNKQRELEELYSLEEYTGDISKEITKFISTEFFGS